MGLWSAGVLHFLHNRRLTGLPGNDQSFIVLYQQLEAVTHETLDQIQLAQHKLIAKKLQENPEAILALARRHDGQDPEGGRAPAGFAFCRRPQRKGNRRDHQT
jgi:hypothetical protein